MCTRAPLLFRRREAVRHPEYALSSLKRSQAVNRIFIVT